jgi:hypothetical protein
MAAFIQAYGTIGFTPCVNATLEIGIEKVALFAITILGVLVPTHASLQLPSGQWTSKLGVFEDIRHSVLDAVNGPLYGQVVQFLARPRP